ncbi:amidohydrolase family protein [Sphingopyxis fribergensis]
MIGAAALLGLASLSAGAATQENVYIEAGRLLADPATGKIDEAVTIIVQNGRITGIEPGYKEHPRQRVIDLRDKFVLPGLIDSHVHLLASLPEGTVDRSRRSSARIAMRGVANARTTLMAGFTTVADLGGDNEAIFALRDAIAAGETPGPRVLAAGNPVSPDGGDSDIHGLPDAVAELIRPQTICSGADDCRRVVRRQINSGADVVKITATGGVLAQTDTGVDQQFTQDELDAIVIAAHMLGKTVTAHAHGDAGIRAALTAGVDSIEHGTFHTAQSDALFRSGGVFFIPTLMAGAEVTRRAEDPGWRTPAVREKAKSVGPQMMDGARRARQAGIRIAFGTDSGVTPHGQNAQEFLLLQQAGFSPREAICAATVSAAEHLGLGDVGRIAAGRRADIIAVAGNPLEDLAVLQQMDFVMKEGIVYRADRKEESDGSF